MKYEPLVIPESESDRLFLETKADTANQIAKVFGVPIHLLQNHERATFENVQHLQEEFNKRLPIIYSKHHKRLPRKEKKSVKKTALYTKSFCIYVRVKCSR